nr:DNA mismatch repair endonuclease MutL [uncultured Dorea sp.]
MSKIQVLDQITIDKIAAGEVIERPASVVKELAENAIDAGATAVTVEIKEGGITFMRIADNGIGIDKEDVRAAFLRHSTSKIRSAEDLAHISSLGFRGEALSSIAAVSQVELLTKTKEAEFGVRYKIAGGKEESLEDAGAPDGTTFLIRQLFYNTPARRKFLKTAMTEASHVGDLVTRLALSHPEVSFRFINNGQVKLHTSGNGNLKDVIYHIYGREIASNLIEVDFERKGIHITGYLGKPLISRGNRNFENYFVDGRYIKSSIISKAIEDGYKDFTMQHKYPFVVLYLDVDTEHVDVNVHPTKMDVRFNNQQEIYNTLFAAVDDGLHERELIPEVTLDDIKIPEEPKESKKDLPKKSEAEHTEKLRTSLQSPQNEDEKLQYFMNEMKKRVYSYHEALHENKQETTHASSYTDSCKPQKNVSVQDSYKPQKNIPAPDSCKPQKNVQAQSSYEPQQNMQAQSSYEPQQNMQAQGSQIAEMPNYTARQVPAEKPQQLNFFEEKLLEPQAKAEHKIIGQVFDTYWLVEFHDNLYIIDQHAAHERVLYEQTLKGMKTREFTSQLISPPIVLNLSMQEAELLGLYMDQFTRIGFEIEEFGQDSYAVRAVPDNLFSIAKKELLMEMIDSLSDEINRNAPSNLIDEKIASMSCKAAVKGNMRLSAAEVDTLITELLSLDNPYHCPHGRPTIIAMSRRELEKKFKRIV